MHIMLLELCKERESPTIKQKRMRDLWKLNGVQKLWIQRGLLNFSCAMEEALLWQLLHYVPGSHFQLINISCKLEIYNVSIA